MLKFTLDVPIISNPKAYTTEISGLLSQCTTNQDSLNMKGRLQRINLPLQADLLEGNMHSSCGLHFFKRYFTV